MNECHCTLHKMHWMKRPQEGLPLHCQPFAYLCVVQNVVVLLLLLLMLLSGLQMCSSSSGRRGRRCVVVVVVVKVRMVSQLTLRSRRHRDILSTAIVHCNINSPSQCLSFMYTQSHGVAMSSWMFLLQNMSCLVTRAACSELRPGLG